MKLKKLEINGFKSFPEKTSIHFPTGICAVVGPNGCGKSNLVDAIRWVMGEQSVKTLRGKSMEDVIFAGSRNQPPLNMAEVSLTLVNDNGTAPEELKDYSEIMLTRRLYRSGESGYFLNKRPCRLKDIRHVFLGSGLTARSYAIISQGNVGAITEAGPEERRYFIEEAAGITRYKARKDETLRKIKATNQNLLRVQDIISEIERRLRSLKRQVQKARRYKKYQRRIRELDIRLGIARYEGWRLKIAETSSLLEQLRDADLGHQTSLQQIDAAIEEIRVKRLEKEKEISAQRAKRFETQRQADRTENDLAHLKSESQRLTREADELEEAREELRRKNRTIETDIAALEQENAGLQEKIEAAGSQLQSRRAASQGIRQRLEEGQRRLEEHKSTLMDLVASEAGHKNMLQSALNNRESLQRRLKRADEQEAAASREVETLSADRQKAEQQHRLLQEEIQVVGSRIDTTRAALDKKSRELTEQVKAAQSLELERHKAVSRHTTLKKMEDSFEWYRGGVRAIMKGRTETGLAPRAADGIIGLMVDILEPRPGYETAVEAVLGESLQYVLVSDQATGSRAIDYLQRENAGRSGFIPVSSLKTGTLPGAVGPDPDKSLLRHVTVQPGFEAIAESLLGHVTLARDLEEALEIFNANGKSQSVVTPEGQLISRRGIMVGGSSENLAGILAKKTEIRQLAEQIASLEDDIRAARGRQNDIEKEVRQLEIDLQQLLEEKGDLDADIAQSERDRYRLDEALKHARRRLEIVRLEQEQFMGEEMDIDEELARHNETLARIAREVREAQEKVSRMSLAVDDLSGEVERSTQDVVELQLEHNALKSRIENNRRTLERLGAFYRDGQARYEQIGGEIDQKRRKAAEAAEAMGGLHQQLNTLYETLKRLDREIDSQTAAYAEIDSALQEKDTTVSRIQSEREALSEKIRMLELDRNRLQMQCENMATRLQESYHQPLALLKREMTAAGEADKQETVEVDSPLFEEMEAELSTLRQRLEKIGDVNLEAPGEFEELSERLDFLVKQRDDLVSAIDDLKRVVAKINRVTQKRFMETFEAVNQKLKEVFPRLFEGGSAKLVLTEPGKPLETGVEFMVHPPGKKLTRMSLLSGGEKAMAAIAFIFSIFLLKPASFCLMDEIDAPLDEANIYRFNNMLKVIGEKSQIVMITHNKKSMEFAETLFGVTMEKKGISKLVSVNLNREDTLN
jgi:chromosome segregation protein